MPLGFFGILSCSLKYCSSFFSVIARCDVLSCIFVLQCFSRSNSISIFHFHQVVPFPFLLRHCNGRYNQMKIVRWWITTIIFFFFASNMAILLSNFDIYGLLIVILIRSCHTIHQQLYTYSFLLPQPERPVRFWKLYWNKNLT